MAPYHILSLDGGGIRGILTAGLLEALEARQPGFLSLVNLFAGTSTGGILALGLASGLSPSEACELYENCGKAVFADSPWDDIRDLDRLIGADYSQGPLKRLLEEVFNDKTLGDLPVNVLIPTLDLDNKPSDPTVIRTWKAKFFHNFPGRGSDAHERIVDVALRTSAAPTYFPIYQGYVDGGVVANNPAMCALAQALHDETGNQLLSNLRLLSVGTGFNPHYIDKENADWGLVQWAPHLISLIMEGSMGLVEYQCMQLLGRRFHRLNPKLPWQIPLDRVDQIDLLKNIAKETDITATVTWLKNNYRAEPANQGRKVA